MWYVMRMSTSLTTTVRLDAEDAEALRKARSNGVTTFPLRRAFRKASRPGQPSSCECQSYVDETIADVASVSVSGAIRSARS